MTLKPTSNGLSIAGVRHSFGARKALDDVSLTVEPGQFCALLGPNGAGKSTLFNLLTRLLAPQTGYIEVAGFDLARDPQKALARVGVVFQQPTLDLDLSVRQNLTYFAALHGIGKREARKRIDTLLDQLSMGERAGEKVRALNGGHRRRMEIARALLHKPDILLLDEPTVGLDAPTRDWVTDHLHTIAQERSLCVLWTTHLVDEVRPQDQLVVLNKGKVVAQGQCSDLTGTDNLSNCFRRWTEAKHAETAA